MGAWKLGRQIYCRWKPQSINIKADLPPPPRKQKCASFTFMAATYKQHRQNARCIIPSHIYMLSSSHGFLSLQCPTQQLSVTRQKKKTPNFIPQPPHATPTAVSPY